MHGLQDYFSPAYRIVLHSLGRETKLLFVVIIFLSALFLFPPQYYHSTVKSCKKTFNLQEAPGGG